MMNKIVQEAIAVVVFVLIFMFLIPMLPSLFNIIAIIMLVFIAIFWFLKINGVIG